MEKMTWNQMCRHIVESYGTDEFDMFMGREHSLICDMLDNGCPMSDIKAASILPDSYIAMLLVLWKVAEKIYDAHWCIRAKIKRNKIKYMFKE